MPMTADRFCLSIIFAIMAFIVYWFKGVGDVMNEQQK